MQQNISKLCSGIQKNILCVPALIFHNYLSFTSNR